MRRTPEEIAKMRRAGKVVAEMLDETRAAIRPGVTTADLDRVARDVLERRGRQVELPQLPRLPCRDLHLAEQHDRARHPRPDSCWRRVTSSRSTAERSSRDTTATPPTPLRSARSPARPRACWR